MTGVLELVGPGVDRLDGPLKVSGGASYPNDFTYVNLAHAALVGSTIAAGRIRAISTEQAEAAPGVHAVITYRNAPRLAPGPMTLLGPSPPVPLQDDRILHYGQHLAVVVADTEEQAIAAARLVHVDYEPGDPLLDPGDPRAQVLINPTGLDSERGDVAAAMASAEVVYEATFTTVDNTNNPLGLFSTVAVWHGDALTIHDSTQWPSNVRVTLAQQFGVPESGVRVLAPYVGGGFGAGLRVWSHVVIAAMAARMTKRPVKIVLTRPQMFTAVGHRPSSVQHIRIGANRGGELVAIDHDSTAPVAMEDDNVALVTAGTVVAYACPNVTARDRLVRLNIPCPGSMRAPGDAEGSFALESAMDELSYMLGVDPIELRLRNYAEVHPQLNLPWSSKALRECYERGAQSFGWSRRDPRPRSMRSDGWLVGYGMAGISFFWWQAPCEARVSVRRDGTAFVRSAATDIGTGTYTVMAQLSAQLLGLDLHQVRFDLGDSDMPTSPMAGGSGLTGALGNAIHAACRNVVQGFLDLVRDDPDSPLRGSDPGGVTVAGARIQRVDDPSSGETYAEILTRHGLAELSADGRSAPGRPEETGMAPTGPFGAKFVEVHVDPDLGLLRVARVVSAIDGGRILNEKTARSQIIGGTVGGIGMAMFEETITDAGTGRIANATFADYLVPVNADVPDMEVIFVGEPDRATATGTKGVGEIGLAGIPAAIANAVFHATGRRIRTLPITIDQLML